MKKLIALVLLMTFIFSLAGCSLDRSTQENASNETNNSSKDLLSSIGYCVPNYGSTNELHCDKFLKILKSRPKTPQRPLRKPKCARYRRPF